MITIENLSKTFDDKSVLNNINLNVKTGTTKVIIGRSGVGKSVLLKIIMGIMSPDAGRVLINGQDVTAMSETEYNKIRLAIGMVFQGGALFDSMTVEENVGFVLDEFMSLPPTEYSARVDEALDMVGLSEVRQLYPSSLSGGMKKRVSIARVLCMRPKFILYDEPTDEVDPVTGDSLDTVINKLRDQLKVTSIVVTHDMTSAFKVGDTIAMLHQGMLIADGTVDDIRQAIHPVVRQFIQGEALGPIWDQEQLVHRYVRS